MLRIYPVVLGVLKPLQPALQRIEGLARQFRRASSSVALNRGEGMYSRGQNRNARYHNARGSARETLSCLEVAAVFGYVREDEQLNDQLNRIVGSLVRLVRAYADPGEQLVSSRVARPTRMPISLDASVDAAN
jgi:four helix bundle protein